MGRYISVHSILTVFAFSIKSKLGFPHIYLKAGQKIEDSADSKKGLYVLGASNFTRNAILFIWRTQTRFYQSEMSLNSSTAEVTVHSTLLRPIDFDLFVRFLNINRI